MLALQVFTKNVCILYSKGSGNRLIQIISWVSLGDPVVTNEPPNLRGPTQCMLLSHTKTKANWQGLLSCQRVENPGSCHLLICSLRTWLPLLPDNRDGEGTRALKRLTLDMPHVIFVRSHIAKT